MNEESEAGLGDVIREVRKKQGWSQGELGEKSGVSRPTIARVEANNDVTTATIAKVARALGLKLELRDRAGASTSGTAVAGARRQGRSNGREGE